MPVDSGLVSVRVPGALPSGPGQRGSVPREGLPFSAPPTLPWPPETRVLRPGLRSPGSMRSNSGPGLLSGGPVSSLGSGPEGLGPAGRDPFLGAPHLSLRRRSLVLLRYWGQPSTLAFIVTGGSVGGVAATSVSGGAERGPFVGKRPLRLVPESPSKSCARGRAGRVVARTRTWQKRFWRGTERWLGNVRQDRVSDCSIQ
jgi:hypothetical protein